MASNTTPSFRFQKPSPQDATTYAEILKEYLICNVTNRIDLIQSTPQIDGVVYYSDQAISTMSLSEIHRENASTKVIYGVSGTPKSYYLFSANMNQITANFTSYDYTKENKTSLSKLFSVGPPIKETVANSTDSRYTTRFKDEAIIPAGHLNWLNDDKIDATFLFLPVAIPILASSQVQEGPVTDPAVISSLTKIHPVLNTWIQAIANNRIVPQSVTKMRDWDAISPKNYGIPIAPAGPELEKTLVRFGSVKESFDSKIERLFPKPVPTQLVDLTHLPQGREKRKRDPSSSDEEDASQTVEVPEKFAKFSKTLELLGPIPTFDAQDNIVHLETPAFTEDFQDILKSSSSTKSMSKAIITLLHSRLMGEEKTVETSSSGLLIYQSLVTHTHRSSYLQPFYSYKKHPYP